MVRRVKKRIGLKEHLTDSDQRVRLGPRLLADNLNVTGSSCSAVYAGYMSPFVLTKIGEVRAFARIGKDICVKAEAGLLGMLDEIEVSDLRDAFNELEADTRDLGLEKEDESEVQRSCDESEKKITVMRDMYIGGKWDAEDEVLEWMGFYTGGAIVHWHLLHGAAEALEHTALRDLCVDALDLYKDLFVTDEEFLQELGAIRAG